MTEIGEYKFVIIFTLIVILIIGGMFGLALYKDYQAEQAVLAMKEAKKVELSRYNYLTEEQNPVATITMENGKKIVLELYPKLAPTTVENFISLANAGFYDGVPFHRIEEGFVIQGGDKNGTGKTPSEYTIEGEFSANDIESNTLKHEKGIISMARSPYNNNSAFSQFFICLSAIPSLDGKYAAFGKVIEGLDVVEALGKTETKSKDTSSADFAVPVVAPVMKTVTVDTKGIEYAKPATM